MTEPELPDGVAWPLVLAVVVAHNGRAWLPGCLKSLAMQSYPSLEVVVVDNASADPEEVQRLVQRLLPQAAILRLQRNVGFGAAANRALELAPDARVAEYYLFLHDDVALDRECVGLLVASALETEAGVVGGKGLSWDEPEVLLEVGMSADEFGYPVSGLEEGEIDQSQHDVRREVLFVTSACILVSRLTVERCGSWDGAYFLFGEDLDLCIRARLCGFPVVVAPAARFYHAVAMATGRREDPPPEPIRYFTRRNRLRTIAKNASAARVLILIALYSLVISAEVLLLAVLRRFDEIPPYARAYRWFLRSLPDVARRRRAVQARREVSDRRVRRYMVRDLPRARIFLERRLMQWGAETLRFSQKTFSQLSPTAVGARVNRLRRSPGLMTSVAVAAVLLLAGRHVLLGPPVGAGSLWPFPIATHRLLSDYFAAWRQIGLGTTAAPPPSLPLYWLVGIAAVGNAALAQKILVGALLILGLAGMYRFVRRRSAVTLAPALATGLYGLAPVVRLAMTTADLGALALFAFGPAMLDTVLRMLGPSPGSAKGPTPGTHALRPPVPRTVDAMTRQAIRLGLMTALVLALAPSALLAIVAMWLLAGGYALIGAGWSEDAWRRLGWVLLSIVVALIVLVPWSLQALRPSGAILSAVFSGLGGGANFAPAWSAMDFAHSMLVVPGVSLLAGIVTVTAVGAAMLIASRSRRREVRLLSVVIVVFGLWTGFVAKGLLPAPTATPALWLVFPLIALAASGGYLLAALREDVPRHAAGWRQSVGAGAAAVFGLAAVLGLFPTLASWGPPPSSAVAGTGNQSQTGPLAALQGAAVGIPEFRVLWLGPSFVNPTRVALDPQGSVPYLLTGSDGLSVLDDSPLPVGPAGRWLSGVVKSLVDGRTDLAGHLLAPAAVRYLVVDRGDPAANAAVLRQADFALDQQLGSVDIYRNLEVLPVAGSSPQALVGPSTAGPSDLSQLLQAQWSPPPALRRTSLGAFEGAASRSSLVLLGEAYASGWRATIAGRVLIHEKAFGWANAFVVPAGVPGAGRAGAGPAAGGGTSSATVSPGPAGSGPGAVGPVTVSIDFRGEYKRVAWVALEAVLLALALLMATVGRVVRPPGAPAREEPMSGDEQARQARLGDLLTRSADPVPVGAGQGGRHQAWASRRRAAARRGASAPEAHQAPEFVPGRARAPAARTAPEPPGPRFRFKGPILKLASLKAPVFKPPAPKPPAPQPPAPQPPGRRAPFSNAPTPAPPVSRAPTPGGPVSRAPTSGGPASRAPAPAPPVSRAPTPGGPASRAPTPAPPVSRAPTPGGPAAKAPMPPTPPWRPRDASAPARRPGPGSGPSGPGSRSGGPTPRDR